MEERRQPTDLQGTSFAEPFAFRRRLRQADTRIDFIPVLDMIVIAMLVIRLAAGGSCGSACDRDEDATFATNGGGADHR